MELRQSKSSISGFCVILFTMIQITGNQNGFTQGDLSDSGIDTSKAEIKVKKYKPNISGFIQFQTLWHFDSNGDGETLPWRFRVQRVRLRVEGKVAKKISYQVEIDPRAPEITGILRDAYISMSYIPRHEIILGQQKTQFGYENRVSSSQLYFVNRTDVSDNLSRGITLRDIGIGLIGSVPINDKYRFEDAITLVNGAGMNVQYDNTKKKNVWGRFGIRYKSDDLLWRFGASGGYGDLFEPADTIAGTDAYIMDFSRLGTDFQVEHKWFTMAAEYVLGWNKEPDGKSKASGYYCLFTGKTPWNIGPLARYENLDGEFIRWIFGAYYGKPKDRIRVLANYEIRKVEGDPDFPFGEDNRFYLWLQIRF
jgi:hypothetical protein